MRDYLAATRDRVVVFDGSMGATLEQFDLSLERDYKLPGRAHEALVLNRPDVIEDLHRSMVEVGAEVVETDTFQASRLKLDEWGLERAHATRSTARPPRSRAARSARSASSPARSARPATSPPPTTRRSARSRFRELVAIFEEQAQRPGRRRLRPADHRDRAGHPRGQGRGLRRPRGVQGGRPRRADPDLRLAPAQRRQDAARHRHLARCWPRSRRSRSTSSASTARPARRTCATRSASSASSARARCSASRTPASRTRARRARRSSPRQPGPLADTLGEFVERYGVSSSAAAAARPPSTSRAIVERVGGPHAGRAPRPAPAARLLDDDRDAARPGPRADARRRARELARARARRRSCCSPTTTTASSRSPRTRSRAARTCSTSASR